MAGAGIQVHNLDYIRPGSSGVHQHCQEQESNMHIYEDKKKKIIVKFLFRLSAEDTWFLQLCVYTFVVLSTLISTGECSPTGSSVRAEGT